MKYYLHDTSAHDDEKITKVFNKYGYEGTGLFWAILEKLGKQEKPVETEVLKFQLRIDKRLQKIWNYLEEIGLIISKNGETFNENIVDYSGKYQSTKEKIKNRVKKFRENQDVTQNVTRYKDECNADVTLVNKVNEIKESKVNKETVPVVSASPLLTTKLWSYEKRDFLNGEQWQYNFCSEKRIKPPDLKILMSEFISEIELKEDLKDVRALRSHFVNWYNKKNKNGTKHYSTNSTHSPGRDINFDRP